MGTREDGSLDFGFYHTVKIVGGEQVGAEIVLEVGPDMFGNRVNVEDLAGTNVVVEGDFILGASLEVPADGGGTSPSASIGALSIGASEGYGVGVNSTETISIQDIYNAAVDALSPFPDAEDEPDPPEEGPPRSR